MTMHAKFAEFRWNGIIITIPLDKDKREEKSYLFSWGLNVQQKLKLSTPIQKQVPIRISYDFKHQA